MMDLVRYLSVSLAALVLANASAVSAQSSQDVPTLPDVEIVGRTTAQAVRSFVRDVSAPSMDRGLARWRGTICPGVANLSPQAAQGIVDRVSVIATGLGLRTGDPGCDPNIVVIFTDDGAGMARALIELNPDVFRQNVSGTNRGAAAFRDFQLADRPARWWSLSVVLDGRTGQQAFRYPGGPTSAQIPGDDDSPLGAAPMVKRDGASRLNSQLIDNLYKTIVIIDVDQIGTVDTERLGDYIALISLAQVDPAADTSGFDTVLNLFTNPGQPGLTDWDRAYLSAVYAPRSERTAPGAQSGEVANIMIRNMAARIRAQGTPEAVAP